MNVLNISNLGTPVCQSVHFIMDDCPFIRTLQEWWQTLKILWLPIYPLQTRCCQPVCRNAFQIADLGHHDLAGIVFDATGLVLS